MATVEEWTEEFLRTVPVASLALGVFSTAMGIITVWHYGPLAKRVFYKDSQLLVSVRYPGQRHELRDFVQPDNPDIVALYGKTGPDAWSCLDWVCRNIAYRHDVAEFWQFPSETLVRRQGDCEDSSLLLCSLLENFTDSYVVLGSYRDYGHAWCQSDGQLFETTFTSAQPVPDPEHYSPYILFNQEKVIELWPGALKDIFRLSRNEVAKLKLMAAAYVGS